MALPSVAGTKMCRLCVDTNGPFLNIFEFGLDLPIKIKKLLNVVINEWDNLPHKICFKCSTKVTELDEFTQNSVKAQAKLLARFGKQLKLKDEKVSNAKMVWEMKLKENNLSNDEYCDKLIKKALGNFPIEDNSKFEDFQNPIIFKDLRIVLSRVDDKLDNKYNISEKMWLESWLSITVSGIGNVFSCKKCSRILTKKSLTYTHICSSAILKNKKLFAVEKNDDSRNCSDSNNINTNGSSNSIRLLNTDCLLPIGTKGTSCLNQYMLKMPDNSFVLLRVIDSDANSHGSVSHDINNVKEQLKKVSVKEIEKNSEISNTEELLLNDDQSENSILESKTKPGPLSRKRTRNGRFVAQKQKKNRRKEKDSKNQKNIFSDNDNQFYNEEYINDYDSFDEYLLDTVIKSSLATSSKPCPLSRRDKRKKLQTVQTRTNNKTRSCKDTQNNPSKTPKRDEAYPEGLWDQSYDYCQDVFLNETIDQNHPSDNDYNDRSNKHYKVSQNKCGKIVLSNVESFNKDSNQKRKRKKAQYNEEIQSSTVIEALQNKEFFTFVNVDPLLQGPCLSPTIDTVQESQISTTVVPSYNDQSKTNTRKKLSVDRQTNKPTKLDVCYNCKQEFTSMALLASHLEQCFD